MQSQATLVGAKCRVELNTIAAVDTDFAAVGLPHHTELDDALWHGNHLESGPVFRVLLEQRTVLKGRHKL